MKEKWKIIIWMDKDALFGMIIVIWIVNSKKES
jgi:hypothetical protein